MIVVNPDEFYTINKLHFGQPRADLYNILIPDNNVQQNVLVCLVVQYVKYDRTKFERQVPIVLLLSVIRPDNGELKTGTVIVLPQPDIRSLD
jgi:hypothetical protein